ncbi:hypothetical protein [Tomitella fengzijianii]|uniref:hypothetical protein n=1 Tax=Tomitella fengzijianii TaxID=2597660 RepID=UPI00131EBC16|nr:hypothetical protein [Tomitella fengzijianii]
MRSSFPGFSHEDRKRVTLEIIQYLARNPERWASEIRRHVSVPQDLDTGPVNSILHSQRSAGVFRFNSYDDKRWSLSKRFRKDSAHGTAIAVSDAGMHVGDRIYDWRLDEGEQSVEVVAPHVEAEYRTLGFDVLPNDYAVTADAARRVPEWQRVYGAPHGGFDVDRLRALDQLNKRYECVPRTILRPREGWGGDGVDVFDAAARYHVLELRFPECTTAVAVSPAPSYGVYVTRSDALGRPWHDVLRGARVDARGTGARPLKFTEGPGGLGRVEALVGRITAYIECQPEDFADLDRKPHFEEWSRRYVVY